MDRLVSPQGFSARVLLLYRGSTRAVCKVGCGWAKGSFSRLQATGKVIGEWSTLSWRAHARNRQWIRAGIHIGLCRTGCHARIGKSAAVRAHQNQTGQWKRGRFG